MQNDSPVLEVELDVDEMAKSHKAWTLVPGSANFLSLPIPLFLCYGFYLKLERKINKYMIFKLLLLDGGIMWNALR